MSPEIIFALQLVLGYIAWLLCFGVYIMPRLKAMDRIAAHRAMATLNSFRFFGLVFILPGSSAPICLLASPRSLPTGIWQPESLQSWRFSR